jgi:hypothetical protein
VTRLRVRHLRLSGVLRPYDVSFTDDDGEIAPLSVIAGEISTGKTSILQFITYCLGGNQFPLHDEIRQAVQTALLEIDIDGVAYVIERTCVERPSKTATVHSCALDDLAEPHPAVEYLLTPPSDTGSLSYFLLGHLGISEIDLKEAPTQSASGVDRLSIRDLMRFIYIRYEDLGAEYLMRENQPVLRLKNEQVIDVLFNAHDNHAASVAAEVKKIQENLARGEAQLDTIVGFLSEQRVPAREVLVESIAAVDAELTTATDLLAQVESQMSAAADFGAEQRAAHQQAMQVANSAANERRSTTTQIERLTALAAQYDQDVKKLVFAKEANRLFDPLMIAICPWCLQPVATGSPDDGECTVCHQPLGSEQSETDLDLDRELRAVKRRQSELTDYLNELHAASHAADETLDAAVARARASQRSLDQVMQSRFAPFIDQRDRLISSVAAATQDRAQLEKYVSMHDGAQRRRDELGRLRQQLAGMQLELANAEVTRRTRSDAVAALTERFASILVDFQFPKLTDPYLDNRYTPHARGVLYNQLGSAGARTLVTLAWYLAIFEVVTELGGPHPGLLLIDSPQKGLRATAGEQGDEFQAPSIAASVYRHLVDWAAFDVGRSAQIIVVDNSPQPIAESAVIVRYSASASIPPYGLIDDATT